MGESGPVTISDGVVESVEAKVHTLPTFHTRTRAYPHARARALRRTRTKAHTHTHTMHAYRGGARVHWGERARHHPGRLCGGERRGHSDHIRGPGDLGPGRAAAHRHRRSRTRSVETGFGKAQSGTDRGLFTWRASHLPEGPGLHIHLHTLLTVRTFGSHPMISLQHTSNAHLSEAQGVHISPAHSRHCTHFLDLVS